MRVHRDCAERYDALKRRLAELYPTDIVRYADGKDEFIKEMDARAASWLTARSTDSLPASVSHQ